MLEDTTEGMERPKGVPRQSSNLAKSNGTFERKNDPNAVNKFYGRYKKRENGNGRGLQPDCSNRRPFPQKSRSALDKRPRQRGCVGYRQRETVAETEGVEPESTTPQHGIPKKVIANHLWNFQYTRRENVVGSTRQPRARRPRITYNKERYLQANCQFVVKDSGDYTLQATDPDALVDWDLVEQVRTFSHEQTTCPICLQPPAAGKITKCGHVYCWACILHYIDLDDRTWRKCPICFESIHKSDLRSVRVLRKVEPKVGDTITLQLMKRERSSTHAVPLAHWQDREGCPYNIDDQVNTEYVKVLVASAQQIQTSVIEEERQALKMHMTSAEPSEVCFIESAMALLNEREDALLERTKVMEENAQLIEELEGASSADDMGVGNGGREKGARTKTVAASPPAPPLAKNVSFDGSKIRKQYADAFEELEDEEEDLFLSGELSDHEKQWDNEEDEESTEGVPFSSPPSVRSQGSVASEEGSLSPPADDSLAFLPPEMLQEATLTAEEAIEQLALPAQLSNGAEAPRRNRNQSKSAFYFYQASDGQQIYLHSVNARCIDHQYGSLEHGPPTITAKIVEKDIAFMTDNLRKRLRYLSHLPLTCEFQVVEVKLQPPVVSTETLGHFAKDLKKRVQHRLRVLREDKRQARKQHDAERKSYGQYPEHRLPLDNHEDFPAPISDLEERRRQSSLSDTASLASPPNPSPLESELNASAADFVPRLKADNIQCSWAAAVKSKKQPVVAAWGSGNGGAAAAATPTPPHRVDSEESDNEDRIPVPAFQDSFSIDISVALESSKQNTGGHTNGKAGKKKSKPTLLYSTSMQRR